MKKAVQLNISIIIISIILCLNMFSVKAYASNYNLDKSSENMDERVYITYKNAIEIQMSKILSKPNLNSNDIDVLKALNRVNNSSNDKLTLLEEEYKSLKDYRIIAIKLDLQAEIENGYDFTYRNPIESQISEILINNEKMTEELKEYLFQLNKINTENTKNSNKILNLNVLLKNIKSNEIKQNINSIIKDIENEASIPPSVDELPVKTLIIGQYIIYMPSLTTDNLICAKNTMPDNGKMYYKSEFIDGQWIIMNDISELYDLMINNSYKIVTDTSILENIEYIAQIDKDGNLIEYRKFKQYMNSLNNASTEESDDELANSLNEQLSTIENAYLSDSLSNMFAESRTAEAKLEALCDLFEESNDNRISEIIDAYKEEIESGNVDKYDNAIKKYVDKLKDEASGTDEDNKLIEDLEKINCVPQSVKEQRELEAQLASAENRNDKLTADTIKMLLGMPVEDNTSDLQKIADELRSQGLTNLADMVQGQTFSDEELNSFKPLDELLETLVATTVLLSPDKSKLIANIKYEKLIQAISNNKDKNNSLLKNLREASFNTIKEQCDNLIKDKENQAKEIKSLNGKKDSLIKKLDIAISNNDKESVINLYNQVLEIETKINDLNNKLTSTNTAIDNLSDSINKYCKILDLSYLLKIKDEIDGIKENNKDYMLDIVEMMVQRYQLIEEYKVEKNRGQTISMSRLREEIAKRDYKINYILSLNILDKELVDIKYNIRLAEVLGNKDMKNIYLAKLKLYNTNKITKENYNKEIIEKCEKYLETK